MNEVVPCILVSNDDYWLPYALKAVEHKFSRYVIYDVGSKDRTLEVIEAFEEDHKENHDLYIRRLPMVPKNVQGAFRNSMIAEARSEWYLILDGDEVYSEKGVQAIQDAYYELQREYELNGKIYGVVRRVEILDDLDRAYGIDPNPLPHHRFYHRTAIWSGSHPGEVPYHQQNSLTERWMDDNITCYHFHNCKRSTTSEDAALLRSQRKKQATYRRGERKEFDVFKELPVLHKPIRGFEPHPVLKEKQNANS